MSLSKKITFSIGRSKVKKGRSVFNLLSSFSIELLFLEKKQMKPTRIMIKIITDGTIMRMMVRDELLLVSAKPNY